MADSTTFSTRSNAKRAAEKAIHDGMRRASTTASRRTQAAGLKSSGIAKTTAKADLCHRQCRVGTGSRRKRKNSRFHLPAPAARKAHWPGW
jgi:hypothetical protein